MLFIMKMLPFIKESMSVYHAIIWTGLKMLTPMFLSFKMKDHFVFNA